MPYKNYIVPYGVKEEFKIEIERLFELGVIKHSDEKIASPSFAI